MGCRKCKKRNFATTPAKQKILVSMLLSGFCKIRVRQPNNKKHIEYICTIRPNYLPQSGSMKYVKQDNRPGMSEFNFWALNKNSGKGLDPEPGWVKIEAKDIIFFEPIESEN